MRRGAKCVMKSAMPIASGTAMIRASAAAQTVPKTSGPTYDQKFGRVALEVVDSATKAGMDWATRKIATAASTTRIRLPETIVSVENTRSPGRCFAGGGGDGSRHGWRVPCECVGLWVSVRGSMPRTPVCPTPVIRPQCGG